MKGNLEVGTDWVQEQMKKGEPLFFVEVRHPGDLDLAVMKARGALRLDADQAPRHLAEIPRERKVVVYTTAPDDELAAALVRLLLSKDYRDVHLLSGGFKAYLSAGLPVEDIGEGQKMPRQRGL
jgi:rhodanese-related sulfurtransferase